MKIKTLNQKQIMAVFGGTRSEENVNEPAWYSSWLTWGAGIVITGLFLYSTYKQYVAPCFEDDHDGM